MKLLKRILFYRLTKNVVSIQTFIAVCMLLIAASNASQPRGVIASHLIELFGDTRVIDWYVALLSVGGLLLLFRNFPPLLLYACTTPLLIALLVSIWLLFPYGLHSPAAFPEILLSRGLILLIIVDRMRRGNGNGAS